MFFYLLTSFAEWERSVIRERTYAGKLRRAQEGRNPGFSAPFGYRHTGKAGSLAICDQEAPAVRAAFALAGHGHGVSAVAAHLNAAGFPTRRGRPWTRAAVHYLLHNPIYKGDLVLGRRPLNPRRGKRPGEPARLRGAPPLVVTANAFAAIVDAATWDLAQGSGGPSSYLLTGLLRCDCGTPMRATAASYRCSACSLALDRRALEDSVAGLLLTRFTLQPADRWRVLSRAQQRYLLCQLLAELVCRCPAMGRLEVAVTWRQSRQ